MLLTKEVFLDISRKKSSYYKEKGYDISFENGKRTCKTLVKVEDLSEYSRVEVDAECDYCNTRQTIKYSTYAKQMRVCGIRKYACSKCYGRKKKDVHEYNLRYDDEYKKRFESKVLKNREFSKTRLHSFDFINSEFEKRGYKLLETEYFGNKHKMKYECKKHGVKEMNYHNLSFGQGCPDCAKEKYRKDVDLFLYELKCKFGDNIIHLGEYKNNNTHTEFYCKECDIAFESRPRTVLNNKCGCPNCTKYKNEKILYDYIRKFHKNASRTVVFDDLIGIGGGNLSYDIGLNIGDNKYLIERQGEQHERPVRFPGMTEDDAKKQFEKQKEHDRRKREYAKRNGYTLIEIWYYEDYKEKLKQYGLCV